MANETLKFKMRVVSVPESLPHKSRAEEIEELVKYLEVNPDISPGLALMNLGEEEPGGGTSGYPWVKLDSSGNPLGLFVNVGGIWKDAQSGRFTRQPIDDLYEQRGVITVNRTVGSGLWQTFSDQVEFDTEFDEIPYVKLWLYGGAIVEDVGGQDTQCVPYQINTFGFGLRVGSDINCTTETRTVQVLWEAVGKRKDV